MRKKQEILEKAESLLESCKQTFVQTRISCRFRNCSNNECSVARNVGKFHYCRLKSQITDETKIEKLFVCDTDEWACRCDDYECRNTEQDAERDFVAIVANPSRCGQLFPKLSALLWVLNDGRHADAALSGQSSSPHGHEKNEENRTSEEDGLWTKILKRVSGGG